MGIPLHSINMLDGSTRSGSYDLARLSVGMILSVASGVPANSVTGVSFTGGSGYTSIPVVTPVGGTFTRPMTLVIPALNAGAITAPLITDSGVYTAAPTSFTVTGGGGTGATVTTPVLGGVGNAVVTAVTFAEGIGTNYWIGLSASTAGDAYWVAKGPTGFSVVLAPAFATVVAPTATIDVLVVA